MNLVHESPTGLHARPTVTVRHIPGQAIRIPARAGTLLLIAFLLWGGLACLTPISWVVLAGTILLPASLLAALIELRPRGRLPLAWGYVLARHVRRPALLVITRTQSVRTHHHSTLPRTQRV